jgi:DNA-binding MarR family transcriptional regulator
MQNQQAEIWLNANIAQKRTGLHQIEEFAFYKTIKKEKNPKKTEVIYANLFEFIQRHRYAEPMKKRGLIRNMPIMEDKRAKRIELTAMGEKVADTCLAKIVKNATMLMKDCRMMTRPMHTIAANIEVKFSALWQKHRNKEFAQIYKELMNEPAIKTH